MSPSSGRRPPSGSVLKPVRFEARTRRQARPPPIGVIDYYAIEGDEVPRGRGWGRSTPGREIEPGHFRFQWHGEPCSVRASSSVRRVIGEHASSGPRRMG